MFLEGPGLVLAEKAHDGGHFADLGLQRGDGECLSSIIFELGQFTDPHSVRMLQLPAFHLGPVMTPMAWGQRVFVKAAQCRENLLASGLPSLCVGGDEFIGQFR